MRPGGRGCCRPRSCERQHGRTLTHTHARRCRNSSHPHPDHTMPLEFSCSSTGHCERFSLYATLSPRRRTLIFLFIPP
jgi:hypothetical protein